ncbi:MAG: 30S ribosomal protein S4 [Candidatus Taylorbacteria bacterium]|nr:30S ribosomal protein S4 [Candidatus Taylorbacteria bacterium]
MQIGPRYKKARYLGVPIFRKTQTQKYAMRAQRKVKTTKRRGGKSEYGRQMLEKQKARYSYGVSGGQFTNYVRKALQLSGDNAKNLIRLLEGRLDNVVVRSGFAPTRSAARQMVSHGHITVGGKIVNIPSCQVNAGDIVGIREGSKSKTLFAKLDEEIKGTKTPAWMMIDLEKKQIRIAGEPSAEMTDLLFDVRSVLEFYTR